MTFETAKGARINTILGKRIFPKQVYVHSDDVKAETGLTIQELVVCWIFSKNNGFQKALDQWKHHQNLMDFKEIQCPR